MFICPTLRWVFLIHFGHITLNFTSTVYMELDMSENFESSAMTNLFLRALYRVKTKNRRVW